MGILPTPLILTIATFVAVSSGQPVTQDASQGPALQPGDTVTLLVPERFLPAGRPGLFDLRQVPVHVVNVSQSDGAIALEGRTDWRTEGFPSLWALAFSKISRSSESTEVELKRDDGVVKLQFGPSVGDVDAAFRALVVHGPPSGPEATAYLDETYRLMATRFFTGPLAGLPVDPQLALVREAHATRSRVTFRHATYRDRRYLVIDLDRLESVLYGLQPNQLARVANAINDQLLADIKRFWRPVAAWSGIDGLEIAAVLPNRMSTAADAPAAGEDSIQWWAPGDLITRFAADAITSQALVDGSVIIVNGNRVQVELAGGRRR